MVAIRTTKQAWKKNERRHADADRLGRRHRRDYGGEQGMTSRRLRARLVRGIPFGTHFFLAGVW